MMLTEDFPRHPFLDEQLDYLISIFVSHRKIWDALTGDELHSFEHKHIVRACAFSEVNPSFP